MVRGNSAAEYSIAVIILDRLGGSWRWRMLSPGKMRLWCGRNLRKEGLWWYLHEIDIFFGNLCFSLENFVRSYESEALSRAMLARTVLTLRCRFWAALIFENLSFLCKRIFREVFFVVST